MSDAQPKTVYVVFEGQDYETPSIVAIFLDKQKAEALVASKKRVENDWWDAWIEEAELTP